MDNLFAWLASAGDILTVFVTAAVTWAGTFIFYRQRKDGMEIENESKQSEEWRKLYLESQEDSRKKDEKIDELRRDMNKLNMCIISLERRVQLNSIYRCDREHCPDRIDRTAKNDPSPALPREGAER